MSFNVIAEVFSALPLKEKLFFVLVAFQSQKLSKQLKNHAFSCVLFVCSLCRVQEVSHLVVRVSTRSSHSAGNSLGIMHFHLVILGCCGALCAVGVERIQTKSKLKNELCAVVIPAAFRNQT